MNKEEIELSERLRKACLEKGITEPRFVAQDCNGDWWHFPTMPFILEKNMMWDIHQSHLAKYLFTDCDSKQDWRETLMEFNPNAGVPLSDVLRRTCDHCGKEL